MQLSTGKVAFPLHFDNGDVEQIFINPYDKGLQERINNFERTINERINKIDFEKHKAAFGEELDTSSFDFSTLMNMPADDLEKLAKKTNAIKEFDDEIEKEFCAEIDSIFDSDVSSKAFKYIPPLAIDKNENGEEELYIISVLHAIADEVQKYGNALKNSTNKYIEKYKKIKNE